MKIPRRLLKDPKPELTAKIRRAASELGRSVRDTLAEAMGAAPPVRLVYGVGDQVLGRIVEPGTPSKRRARTRPGFAPALPELPDPVCSKACGACAYCRRAKDGPEWWLLGPPYPKKGPKR